MGMIHTGEPSFANRENGNPALGYYSTVFFFYCDIDLGILKHRFFFPMQKCTVKEKGKKIAKAPSRD